jgi:hypothetical protein
LLANEALEVLALRPGATPVQIKEAYRDLVKVWHPDRFGSDARLRRKADEKLQQINEAYRVLQSDGGAVVGNRGSSARRSSSSSRYAARRRTTQRVARGWFYGIVGIAAVSFAGLMVIEYRATQAEGSAPAPVQAVASNAVSPMAGGVSAGRSGHAAQEGGGEGDSKGAVPFSVRSLSEGETARLEEACEPQRERLGETAYQVCVSAQVGLMKNPAGSPYLGALNAAERESIKSACAEAKRANGKDAYDRCLTAKMAEWAAEPARPKLSTLNNADRSSVELACRGAKEREGPAAYDRCQVRFMRALAESR